MSLKKIAEVKRKRRFWDGGNNDPEGNADAGRSDGTAGAESQGGFGGPGRDGGGGGNTDAQDAANLAAFDNSQLSTWNGTYGPTYSGGVQTGTSGGMSTGDIQAFVDSFKNEQDLAKASAARNMMGAGGVDMTNKAVGLLGGLFGKGAAAANVGGKINDFLGRESRGYAVDDAAGIGQRGGADSFGDRRNGADNTQPFGTDTPAQTTPATGATTTAAAGNTGMRQYVWDPQARTYRLANLGAQDNPMGYNQGQVFQMAAGGRAPSGISAGMPRFVQGGGTGLSDSVPVQMDDGGEGRLADGEFVIPADVVSGLGGGSSAAGSKMLFDMMERIREQAHGKSQQIRPVDPQQVLPA